MGPGREGSALAQAHAPSPHVDVRIAGLVFAGALVAFVVESQLAQYVQTNLGYRQPFFLFYIVHSSFAIILPLHILYIVATTKYTVRSLLRGLSTAIAIHLPQSSRSRHGSKLGLSPEFPLARFSTLILGMTAGVTFPALFWFIAVSLAPLSDVTALWNANAFFAYLFSVHFFKLQWEKRKLSAVIMATLGALAVVYGGSTAEVQDDGTNSPGGVPKPSAPLVGDLLTLAASVGYGLYQVLYKKYAALPFDPEYEPGHTTLRESAEYESIATNPDVDLEVALAEAEAERLDPAEAVYPPPFGLYPNLLTSLVGLCSLALLWLPIPALHWLGVERFRVPPDLLTVFSIGGIALGGVFFNAGFMVLLGVWGPIVTSVGSLLTIVLVFASDVVFGGAIESLTLWSLAGSGVIVAAFAVLAYDMLRSR